MYSDELSSSCSTVGDENYNVPASVFHERVTCRFVSHVVVVLTHSAFKQKYTSKEYMKNAVIAYHLQIKRSFKVAESDKRRFYVRCSLDPCSFDLKFSVCKGKLDGLAEGRRDDKRP